MLASTRLRGVTLLADRRGATAMEYGVLLAGILVAIAVGVTSVATVAQNLWAIVVANVTPGL